MKTGEYKGVKYSFTQEAQDDLKEMYDIEIVSEIERCINLVIHRLDSTVIIEDGVARLQVTQKITE
jgi:hypothetical protein